jgi:hypothetical protein
MCEKFPFVLILSKDGMWFDKLTTNGGFQTFSHKLYGNLALTVAQPAGESRVKTKEDPIASGLLQSSEFL